MSKKQKLYNLRSSISVEAERIVCLLKSAVYKSDSSVEKDVLADLALEKAEKISRMSEKIGIILKH